MNNDQKNYKIYTYSDFNSKDYPGLDQILNFVEKDKYSDFYEHFPKEYLQQEARHFAIAVKDQENVIGLIRGTIIWNWIELRTLWVLKDKRETGIGSKLINEVKKIVETENLGGIYLTTWSELALQFYESHDFKETHRITDHPPGHSCYFMKWTYLKR